jgi:hypothetical protein
MSTRRAALNIAQARALEERRPYTVWSAIRDSKVVYVVLPDPEKPRTHIACPIAFFPGTPSTL